ncbi:MAG: hypothetical protein KKH94_11465 [Candidatus Omnitrophica bacterium]|nr:hypothetical protein [Candidatus Omnitrophota bacterium]
MAHQIIKQPNGLYALWSSVVDDFILIDASPRDIIMHEINEQSKNIIAHIKEVVGQLDKNEKPYFQFTLSFEDAVETIKKRHGNNTESLRMLGLTKGICTIKKDV